MLCLVCSAEHLTADPLARARPVKEPLNVGGCAGFFVSLSPLPYTARYPKYRSSDVACLCYPTFRSPNLIAITLR
jgi:hypothetical protein